MAEVDGESDVTATRRLNLANGYDMSRLIIYVNKSWACLTLRRSGGRGTGREERRGGGAGAARLVCVRRFKNHVRVDERLLLRIRKCCRIIWLTNVVTF